MFGQIIKPSPNNKVSQISKWVKCKELQLIWKPVPGFQMRYSNLTMMVEYRDNGVSNGSKMACPVVLWDSFAHPFGIIEF